jgi:hypothetical protein
MASTVVYGEYRGMIQVEYGGMAGTVVRRGGYGGMAARCQFCATSPKTLKCLKMLKSLKKLKCLKMLKSLKMLK